MTSKEFLGDRRKALEESFFKKANEKALARLYSAHQTEITKEALCAASGITNEAVLEELVALGFNAKLLAALSLYPLVAVAWASRNVETAERQAVLQAAHDAGISRGDVCHALLEIWLADPPDEKLMHAWHDMIGALKESLDPSAIKAIHDDVMGRAHQVAEAAGGFLGVGTISNPERKVLAELERAFS